MHAKSLWSCPTLCNPMDQSSAGSPAHGILQARILEWVAIFFFRGSSRPRDRSHISYVSCIGRQVLYHWYHLGSPIEKETPLPMEISLTNKIQKRTTVTIILSSVTSFLSWSTSIFNLSFSVRSSILITGIFCLLKK